MPRDASGDRMGPNVAPILPARDGKQPLISVEKQSPFFERLTLVEEGIRVLDKLLLAVFGALQAMDYEVPIFDAISCQCALLSF